MKCSDVRSTQVSVPDLISIAFETMSVKYDDENHRVSDSLLTLRA